jgi:hypothetical protein
LISLLSSVSSPWTCILHLSACLFSNERRDRRCVTRDGLRRRPSDR